ncbi:cytochrome d ubiquinol oxidase subunit II [Chryseolinea sp. H1M3-3]|uniref:cytochrome d ubiquinol oxidase subunit II n=1 Tax=Chryseolinea sp. H1M3-3 TaxID=3034144 RepID=UPI0023EBA017|nr:cytochrome d ubiquinol oxidase subunit II [Chryseolinea sp. H1M3-3]
MEYVVISYLYLSILLYLVLGGADFGAGIIEMFTSQKNIRHTRSTLYHAIGPIWEANHMWLIIAIVILFVGFPMVYSTLSVYLHIPLLIMLMGIVARGTAFVFRHYDAVRDEMQELYNNVFIWSSFLTPFFLGVIAGSTISGHINQAATTFAEAYVFSWFNVFSLSVGLFTVFLCGFMASIYLIGEAQNQNDRRRFVSKAKRMNIAAVGTGALVFLAAVLDEIPLLNWVFGHPVGLMAVIVATLSLLFMWRWIDTPRVMLPRILVGLQVAMILLAVSYAHFPNLVILQGDAKISLLENIAPAKTMQALGWALLIGSVFILPALFYLYYSFQKKENV